MKSLSCIHDDELVVYAVSAPEYPFAHHGLKQHWGETYPPSAFTKKSIRRTKMEFRNSRWADIIDKRLHSRFGPIFLMRCVVTDFIDCLPGAVCAGSLYTVDEKGRVDSVEIRELELVSESCNPKSFIVVLNSPILNYVCKIEYLSNHTVADCDTYEREHLKGSIWTPAFARSLFPQYQFQELPILQRDIKISVLNGQSSYLSEVERAVLRVIDPGPHYGADIDETMSKKMLRIFRRNPSLFV